MTIQERVDYILENYNLQDVQDEWFQLFIKDSLTIQEEREKNKLEKIILILKKKSLKNNEKKVIL